MEFSEEDIEAVQRVIREAASAEDPGGPLALADALTRLIPNARLVVHPLPTTPEDDVAPPRLEAGRTLAPGGAQGRDHRPDATAGAVAGGSLHALRHDVHLPCGGRRAVVLERDVGAGSFSPRERALFGLVAPDVGRAVAAAGAAEGSTAGGLLFDAQGRLLYADPRAATLCQAIGGTSEPPAELAQDARAAAETERVIERSIALASGGWVLASSSSAGGRVLTILEPGRPAPSDRLHALATRRGLTAREREVAALAAEGLTTRRIAAALGMSAPTVGIHLSRIYRKLEVAGKPELIRLVMGS